MQSIRETYPGNFNVASPQEIATMLDRAVLLKFRSLCPSPCSNSERLLHTTMDIGENVEPERLAWRRSSLNKGSQTFKHERPRLHFNDAQRAPQAPPSPTRPRFQRPTRGAKVQQLQCSVAECCSLSFDDVDPFQQEGLTRRMLVFLKSLEDSLSYWEGDAQHKERAFFLLSIPDAGMLAIREAIDLASEFIDRRQHRCAYETLSGVLHWLPSADYDSFVLPELTTPVVQWVEGVQNSSARPAESQLGNADTLKEPEKQSCVDGPAMYPSEELLSAAVPVKNTFVHFDVLAVAASKRSCSVPSSFMPASLGATSNRNMPVCDENDARARLSAQEDCFESFAAKSKATTRQEYDDILSVNMWTALMEDTCEGGSLDEHKYVDASKPWLNFDALPHPPAEDIMTASTCDEASPRSDSTIGGPGAPPGPRELLKRIPECGRHWQVRVNRTFIELDDEDCPGAAARSSSAPARTSQSRGAEQIGHTKTSRSRNRRTGTKQKGKKEHSDSHVTCAKGEGIHKESKDPAGPQVALANSEGGIYRLEWPESIQKLSGTLRMLMRRFTSPFGEFVFTLTPKNAGSSLARGGGPSFQDASGQATLCVKCTSKPAPEVFFAVSLAGESQGPTKQHDFQKKPVFKLPRVLDLWAAVDLSKGTFTLSCTLVVRASG